VTGLEMMEKTKEKEWNRYVKKKVSRALLNFAKILTIIVETQT